MADATLKVKHRVSTDCAENPRTVIGNNQPSLSDAARANLETGVLLLCKEALITAIQDRRLQRGHLRVLAAIAMCINARSAKAWPDRSFIAAKAGLSPKTVSNTILELRNFGYLIADRETVEEAGGRRLTVYTFGNIDHETIRREIAEFVNTLRAQRDVEEDESSPPEGNSEVPAQGERPRPRGIESSPPRGNVPSCGEKSSPPVGDSNNRKEQLDPSPNGDGAGASFLTMQELVWQHGLAYLRHAYGAAMPEVNLRTKLGALVRDYGPGPVLDAIGKAQRQPGGVIDPLSYVHGILRNHGKPSAPSQLPAWKQDINDRNARLRAANRKS